MRAVTKISGVIVLDRNDPLDMTLRSYSVTCGCFPYPGIVVLLEKYPQRLRSEYMMIANMTGGIRVDNPFTSTSEVQLCGLMGLPSAPNGKLKSYCVVGRLEGENEDT